MDRRHEPASSSSVPVDACHSPRDSTHTPVAVRHRCADAGTCCAIAAAPGGVPVLRASRRRRLPPQCRAVPAPGCGTAVAMGKPMVSGGRWGSAHPRHRVTAVASRTRPRRLRGRPRCQHPGDRTWCVDRGRRPIVADRIRTDRDTTRLASRSTGWRNPRSDFVGPGSTRTSLSAPGPMGAAAARDGPVSSPAAPLVRPERGPDATSRRTRSRGLAW